MGEILSLIPKASPILLLSFGMGLLICIISGILIIRSAASFATIGSTDQRLERLERQIEEQSKKLDQLLSHSSQPTQVTIKIDIPLPHPSPEKNIGYFAAIEDTLIVASKAGKTEILASSVFKHISETDSLVNLVLNGKLGVSAIVLGKRSRSVKSAVISDFAVNLEVRNLTNEIVRVQLPKGQVFENKAPRSGIQNLVLAENTELQLNPRESKTVSVGGHCLNSHLAPPNGQPGNITPIAVKFDFDSQASVWAGVRNGIQNGANNTLTK